MWKSKLLKPIGFILIVTSLFFSDLSVSAQKENLPATKRRSQTRKSGGTRGECTQQSNTLTLIVPKNQDSLSDIPKTTLSHPTFVWYLAQQSSVPTKFTLVEPGRTIYAQEFNLEGFGLVALTLPKTVPPLEVGKDYRWTVSLLCSRQNPSRNPYTQAWIERVSNSFYPKEGKKLACDAYEKAEIWYDTLMCYLESKPEIETLRLFEQIDLRDLFNGDQRSSQASPDRVHINNLN